MKLKVAGKKDKPKKKSLGRRLSEEAGKMRKRGKPRFRKPTAEAATRRIEEANAGNFYKLSDGWNRLVVLPITEDMSIPGDWDFPWVEDRAHFCGGNDALSALGLQKRPQELPMAHGCARFREKRTCDWCNHQERLRKSRSAKDKALASALYAGLTCFANIVDLKSPKVVRPFRFGKKIRDELLVAIEDGTEFYDPDNLIEVRIRKTKTGKRDMDVEYSVSIKADREVGAVRDKWLDGLEDLSKFLSHVPSPDEITEALDIMKASSDVGGDDDEDDELYGAGDDDDDDVAF